MHNPHRRNCREKRSPMVARESRPPPNTSRRTDAYKDSACGPCTDEPQYTCESVGRDGWEGGWRAAGSGGTGLSIDAVIGS